MQRCVKRVNDFEDTQRTSTGVAMAMDDLLQMAATWRDIINESLEQRATQAEARTAAANAERDTANALREDMMTPRAERTSTPRDTNGAGADAFKTAVSNALTAAVDHLKENAKNAAEWRQSDIDIRRARELSTLRLDAIENELKEQAHVVHTLKRQVKENQQVITKKLKETEDSLSASMQEMLRRQAELLRSMDMAAENAAARER
ncbi:hypothetical protein KEM52_004387, partial [Ascosphaera acerosa]